MKARLAFIFCSLFLPFALSAAAQTPPAAYDAVNPIIGTAGGGNTFPGATLPFGMIQWSPDTNKDALYAYDDNAILGFSLTHISGAGCPLYGDFAVLPTAAGLSTSPGEDSGGIGPYAAYFDSRERRSPPRLLCRDSRQRHSRRDHGCRTRRNRPLHLPARTSSSPAHQFRLQRQ